MTAKNPETDQQLHAANLAFAGRVTASVTHELNNVLSTVSELSGLLEDVAACAPPSDAKSQERLERIATGLLAQVRRGADIVKRLNRFAHSTDAPIQSVDLQELLELIAGLADPLIRRHGVTLETDLGDASVVIETYAFLLEQLLYLSIDAAASTGERGCPVTIACRPQPSGGTIEIAWQPHNGKEPAADYTAILQLLAQVLHGEVQMTTADDGTRHRVITLPQAVTE